LWLFSVLKAARLPKGDLIVSGGRAVLAATTAGVVTLALVALPLPGLAASPDEACLQAAVNQQRSVFGLPALISDPTLVEIAEDWSVSVESVGIPEDNPGLAAEVPQAWGVLGENVGLGPSCSAVALALFNSPEHRANILDPEYTAIGVGVIAAADGEIYVTEDFAGEYAGTGPAPAPAPPETPAPLVVPAESPAPLVVPAEPPPPATASPAPAPIPSASYLAGPPARKASTDGRMMIEVFAHLSASGAVVPIVGPAPSPAAQGTLRGNGTAQVTSKTTLLGRIGHALGRFFSHLVKPTPHASIAEARPDRRP